MLQEFDALNFNDDNDNPAGGYVHSIGLKIDWQDGPLVGKDGSRLEPSGAFVETVIAAALSRLEYYQASKFASTYNVRAILALEDALTALHERTVDREERGVEGTHQK